MFVDFQQNRTSPKCAAGARTSSPAIGGSVPMIFEASKILSHCPAALLTERSRSDAVTTRSSSLRSAPSLTDDKRPKSIELVRSCQAAPTMLGLTRREKSVLTEVRAA